MESIKYKCCGRGCSAWELSNAHFEFNLIDSTNRSLSNRDNRSGKPLFEQHFDYLTPHNRTSLLFILPPTIPITPYPLLINVNLYPPYKMIPFPQISIIVPKETLEYCSSSADGYFVLPNVYFDLNYVYGVNVNGCMNREAQ